jgi:hypothetical protein
MSSWDSSKEYGIKWRTKACKEWKDNKIKSSKALKGFKWKNIEKQK